MTSSIGSSISSLLGIGSGIDTSELVTKLVAAARTPRETVITDRQATNSTRISALASAKSSLDTFASALTDTLKSSAYKGQPVSNDPTIVAVSLKEGGVPTGLPAQIEVQQLAKAQSLVSATLTDSTTAVGLGTLTLATSSGSYAITIDSSNNTLAGLAKAINDANSGVTATVVTDTNGSRLMLKGATGANNAFTLANSGNADADLQRFIYDGTTNNMTRSQTAQDSIVVLDGVTIQNGSNVLESAIPYVRIDLNKAAPGTLVTLATDQPTSTISDLMGEFVAAYNTLRSALNRATAVGTDAASAGALAGDSGVRDMMRQLSNLSTTELATTGTYKTLSSIGIKTYQDGTLLLDEAKLAAAFAADPTGVTQMINPSVSSSTSLGLAAAVKSIQDKVEATDGALAASEARYSKLATELSKQLEKLDENMGDYEERLSTVYTAMGSKLAALKATQSYLDQQVKIWTNSKD